MPDQQNDDYRVLILAPGGRDSLLMCEVLGGAALDCQGCRDIEEFCRTVGRGTGVAVLTQEAVTAENIDIVACLLEDQPVWSNLPLILLWDPAFAAARGPEILKWLGSGRYIITLERPLGRTTLTTAILAALEARRRQYQVRDLLARQEQAKEELERQVVQRTAALRASEAVLRKAMSAPTVGVLFFSLDGRIHRANETFERMCGYSSQELADMTHWRILTAPEFWGATEQRATELAQHGQVDPYEKQLVRKDGSRWWGLFAPTRLSGSGWNTECVEFVLDVTDRKQAEEQLHRFNEELEQRVAERTAQLQATVEELQRSNEDLENFAWISSHDLQEPLRMISLYVGLLAAEYKDELGANALGYIQYAKEGAARMSQLIKDLLAYSRVNTQGQTPEPTDVNVVLDQVLTNLQPRIEETHARVTHDELPMVAADATQLAQIFQNLIQNAIKFRRDDQPPAVHVAAEHRGDQWLFRVRDNGIGIEPQYFDRIFVPFQRLHADRGKYPGSGIGLAIVKRIIERHHGQVWVESQPGEGSTFFFTLSAAQPPADAERNACHNGKLA